MVRNIIFDWSGTLVDDLPAVWQATNYVFSQAGLPELTLDQFRSEFRLPFSGFYDRFVPQVPLPQLEQWFHAHFRQAQASVVELPHAREFLEFCRARQVRTFLLSTMHPEHFAAQTQRNGFDRLIDRAYLGIWDKRAKIHDILAENQLVPDETMLVGDMQHDIDTARHGGLHSCGVLTGYNSVAQLRASQPDLLVEHLGELRVVLERTQFQLRPSPGCLEPLQPIVTVGALVFNTRREVLMVRTRKWSNLWGIPGGKVKYGEPCVEALRRELKEETNLELANIRFVLAQDCIHSREFYRDAHFLLLNYAAQVQGPPEVVLNDEAQEFRWALVPDALGMALNTPTRILLEAVAEDGFTIAAAGSTDARGGVESEKANAHG